MNALGVDASLSAKEVQQAAHQFARRPGYEAVYDRPDKAFWRDFFRRTMGAETDLAPFDAFYAADVLRERLGRRREGARLVIGPQLAHQSKERVQVGAFVRGEWSENLSLRHQLQAEAEAEYNSVGLGANIGRRGFSPRSNGRQLVAVEERGDGWRGAGLVSWQWNVADRTLVRSGVRARFRAFDSQDASRSRVQLFSVVRIFTEDRFVITGEGSLAYRTSSDEMERRPETETWDWNLGVSVNYLLSRTLR